MVICLLHLNTFDTDFVVKINSSCDRKITKNNGNVLGNTKGCDLKFSRQLKELTDISLLAHRDGLKTKLVPFEDGIRNNVVSVQKITSPNIFTFTKWKIFDLFKPNILFDSFYFFFWITVSCNVMSTFKHGKKFKGHILPFDRCSKMNCWFFVVTFVLLFHVGHGLDLCPWHGLRGNEWTLTINAATINQVAGVAVTQVGGASGTLKTELTGADMVTVIIEAASTIEFTDAGALTIGTANAIAGTDITAAVHSGATTSVFIQAATGIKFAADADLVIGSATVVHANINTALETVVGEDCTNCPADCDNCWPANDQYIYDCVRHNASVLGRFNLIRLI